MVFANLKVVIEPLGNPKDKGWITNFMEKITQTFFKNILRALNVKADHEKYS